MIWIILGSLLVMFSLYRLYFLLKPMMLLSTTLIKEGSVKDINAYRQEIEQLRLEILELNDVHYNEIKNLEDRLIYLENQGPKGHSFQSALSRNIGNKSESLIKKQQSHVTVNHTLKSTESDELLQTKVMHPLFDRVKGLYRIGYKDSDIAKELGIGVSEVKLLIKRIEEI